MKLYKAFISGFSEKEYEKYLSMMSDERRNDVLRKRFDADKKRTVLGECLVRQALSEWFDTDEQSIRLDRNQNGKPFAPDYDIHFSVSHSEDMVICAVSYTPVGADVEYIRPIDRKVSRFACTESDRDFIFSSEYGWETRFFELWTAKEAYVKSVGNGISDLKHFDYFEIKPFCKTETENGYMITVYSKK